MSDHHFQAIMSANPIIAIFKQVQPLTDEAIAELGTLIKHQEFKKNTELLRVGHLAHNMYFINKGLARVYYHMEDKEVTDYFAIDGQFIGAVPSLFNQQPSHKAIQLIEDSDVYYFSAKEFDACCARHPELERAARKMSNYAILQGQQRIESLRFHSAAERYVLLERTYPGITNRCPLQYIASYLNTTPESISRIRAGRQ